MMTEKLIGNAKEERARLFSFFMIWTEQEWASLNATCNVDHNYFISFIINSVLKPCKEWCKSRGQFKSGQYQMKQCELDRNAR